MRSGSSDRRAAGASREPLPVRLTTLQRLLATGGLAAIVLLLGLLIFDGIGRARVDRDAIRNSHQMIEAAQATLQDLTNAETGQRGYLITSDDRYLDPYHKANAAITSDTAELRRLAGSDPMLNRRLDSLSGKIDAKLAELAQTIDLQRAGGIDSARAEVRTNLGKNAMDAVRAELGQISARQEAMLAKRVELSNAYYRTVTITDVAGTIGAVLLALLLNTLLTRYADTQSVAAHQLQAQNIELGDTNKLLADQTMELELQNQQLQDQTVELESQQMQLQEQASELEMQSEELMSSVEELQQQTAAAEESRARAEEATLRAEEASRAKSLFLTTMSHELRTPLNAIGGYVDLLAMEIRGPLVEAQRDDLRRIKKSGNHLLSLINDILNLAKIESGQLDLHIRDVSLATVLDNVDALVAPQIGAKGIEYVYPRCDPSLRVRADSEKLQQILLNVLSNACKFTDSGGRVTVECDAHWQGGNDHAPMVAIWVRDTGRGIASDKLEEIFEPFVQIDRHLTGASQQGVGLGLAISRDLARSMSGDLVAESALRVGTTFLLTLPRGTSAVSAPNAADVARKSTDPLAAQ
jgi:signal transduction histidine kinase